MPELHAIPTIHYSAFSQAIHERAALTGHIIKAQLELTYRCNLHCRHCYTDPYNQKEYFPRELTLPEVHRLLDEMQQMGIIWLNLTGGDIFMRPDFFDIYEAAHRRGFFLQLYTNGTLFTRAIIERLTACPPFSIDISCHSVDEERFDWFTQVPGSYRAFIRGMNLLRESGLPYSLKTKLMAWNRDEVDALRAFTEFSGQAFDYTMSLSPRLNGDCSSLAYRIQPDDMRELSPVGSQEAEADYCSGDGILEQPEDDRLYRCGCGTNTIHINAWGELGTCTFQYEFRRSLRDYSLKEAVQLVFDEIRSARYRSDSACRSCTVHAFCDKQPSQARWEVGHPEAPIPYDCDVAVTRASRSISTPLLHPLRARK